MTKLKLYQILASRYGYTPYQISQMTPKQQVAMACSEEEVSINRMFGV